MRKHLACEVLWQSLFPKERFGPACPAEAGSGKPIFRVFLRKNHGFVAAGLLQICKGLSKSSKNQFFAGPPRYPGTIQTPTWLSGLSWSLIFAAFGILNHAMPRNPRTPIDSSMVIVDESPTGGILHGLRGSRSIGIILSKNIIVKRGEITPPGLEQHVDTKLASRCKLRQDVRFCVVLATTIRGGSV